MDWKHAISDTAQGLSASPEARRGDCTGHHPVVRPLAHLSNTVGRVPTYRLSAQIRWNHRADEWQARGEGKAGQRRRCAAFNVRVRVGV